MWSHRTYSISQEICTRFCCALLCCGYTLTNFPISIRLTSLALWQSNDCPSASKATLMNMDKYFMWIHYERLHNQNKAKHNKTVCIFLGIYCIWHLGCHEKFNAIIPAVIRPMNQIETLLCKYSNERTQNADYINHRAFQLNFSQYEKIFQKGIFCNGRWTCARTDFNDVDYIQL